MGNKYSCEGGNISCHLVHVGNFNIGQELRIQIIICDFSTVWDIYVSKKLYRFDAGNHY